VARVARVARPARPAGAARVARVARVARRGGHPGRSTVAAAVRARGPHRGRVGQASVTVIVTLAQPAASEVSADFSAVSAVSAQRFLTATHSWT
jgi:hypothetical protein